MGTRIPASPPKTNCETTSRPLPNHAVNLSRLSTPSRAERQTNWSLSSAACLERAGFQVGAAALRFRAFRQRSRRSATGLGRLNKSPPTSRENIRFFDFDLRRTQAVENAELPLFSRGLRRSPEMRVTQILQHRLFVVAHPLREVRVIQPLVARRFRHILKHAQLLLHHLLAVPRHLLPLRQHIAFDVLALLRRQLPPVVFLDLLVRPLLWRHAVPLIELLADLVLLIRRKALEGFAVL